MITLLLLMMGVVGCNGEKVNIDFPFEIGEVENIEMYHYTGVPVSAEIKHFKSFFSTNIPSFSL